MTSYSRPGVYITEALTPLSDAASDPSEASAAFVGKTRGGPIGPTLVTSWTQFQALFGGVAYESSDLAYAVYSYFNNASKGCYVVRGVASDAVAASLILYDGTGTTTTDEVMTVTAGAPGTWASDTTSASRVFVTVTASATAGRFDVQIEIGTTTTVVATERFVDLSMDPLDPRYAVDIINSPTIGSKYVTVARSTNIVGNSAPGAVAKSPLTGGSEGVAAVDLVAATALLDSVDLNFVVNVVGATTTDLASIVTWAETSGRHFIVADAPKPAANETAAASVTAMTTFADTFSATSHLAVYGPWMYVADPGSTSGALRLTAPGGAVVGQFIKTDASRGVWKAPAGVDTTIAGAVSPYVNYTNAQQDTLATSGVNLIKVVPGSGVCIWGARTLSAGFPDRYVPIRRLLISLRASLDSLTRFAVFEGNDADLWSTVEDVVGAFLQTQYDLGAFKGTSPDEAFYVICDDTNNTPTTADAGVINIEVGVALKSPAEFIIIRLGQTAAGTTISDDLE